MTKSGKFSVLHTFTGGPGGGTPEGPLVLDSAGNLYGAAGGGNSNCNGGRGLRDYFQIGFERQ